MDEGRRNFADGKQNDVSCWINMEIFMMSFYNVII